MNNAPGFAPGVNPGAAPAQPANAWQPVKPTTTTTTTTTTPSDSSSPSSDGDKSEGLSSKVIIGAGVAALGVFALIAGVVVAMSSGGSASQKLKRRPKSFD